MRIYWLIFVVAFLIQFIPIKSKKQYLWRTVFTFLPLLVFGALRVDFGNDYDSYENIFYEVQSLSYNQLFNVAHYEMGFVLLNKIMPSFRLLLILTTILTIGSYVFLFYKYIPPKYSWLAIALLFFMGKHTIFFMFAGRNGYALAIAIFATPFLVKRKFLPYALLSLLAMSIHTSAIAFMAFLYFGTWGEKISTKTITIYILIIAFVLIVSLTNLITWLEPVFYFLSFDRYEVYYEIAKEYSDASGGVVTMFFAILFVLVVLTAWGGASNKKDIANMHFLSPSISYLIKFIILYSVAICIGSLNYRMSQFFSPFFIVGVVNFVDSCKINPQKIILKYSVLAYVVLSYWFLYRESLYRVYNVYHSLLGDF